MPKRTPINDPLVTQVGARIRLLRIENGFSIRNLAQKAQCCGDTIVQIEAGRSAINTKTLGGIARALNVRPYDLLNYDPEHDDVGYVIEKMRQDPEALRMVKVWTSGTSVDDASTT